uniref:Homeobox domain-containing protein n=1 Tax=Salmo trutta TaxID=8032 RepID=A0A674C9H0_SALTR
MAHMPRRQGSGEIRLLCISTRGVVTVREDAQQGKYRVVYTDQQLLELEKEFQYSRYITIRRKTELALSLSLSERQVQIWFQNSRYITIRRKTELALSLSLSERQVQIWRKTELALSLSLSERRVQIWFQNSRYITIRRKT